MSDGISWAYERREQVDSRRLDKYYTAYRVKYEYKGSWFSIDTVETNLHPDDIMFDSELNSITFLTKVEAVEYLKGHFKYQIEKLNKALVKLEEYK